jgi:hypothetical protein
MRPDPRSRVVAEVATVVVAAAAEVQGTAGDRFNPKK